jgi:glycopeptide antibiotics resistance protein
MWVAVAAFASWQPFDFAIHPAEALTRLSEINLLPFADYYAGTDYNAFTQLLHKTMLLLPLGALLETGARRRSWTATAVALLVAGLLEAGQLFLPGHYPNVTDVPIESAGGWLGFKLMTRLRGVRRPLLGGHGV